MALPRSKNVSSDELKHQVSGKKAVETVFLEEKNIDLKGHDVCDKHNKQYEYLCIDHENLCCAKCVINDHRGCRVNEIENEVTKDSVSLTDVTKTVKDTEKSANDLLKTLKARSKDGELHKQYKLTIETIDKAKQTMITKFDDLKAAVTAEYQQAEKTYSEEIQSNLTKCEHIIDKTQKSAERLSTVERHGADDQKYIVKRVMGGVTVTQTGDIEVMRKQLYRMDASLQMCDQLKYLLGPGKPLANFFINHVPLYAKTNVEAMAVNLTLAASIDLKAGMDNKVEPLYTGLKFLNDGRIVSVDNKNNRLDILGDHLNKLGTFKCPDIPKDIAVISNENVVVTGVNAIGFLEVSKSNDIKLIKEMKNSVNSFSISVIDDSKFLVSTIDSKRFMKMITTTGDEIYFTNLPENEYDIGDSQCTYIRNRDMVVHTDRYMNTVTMYQKDGTTLTPSVVVSDPRIKEPSGVCCGDGESLFVCSEETDSLVHLTHDGNIISTHKLDMRFPWSVCVSKDGKRLAVSNSSNGKSKLQLFEVTKQYL